MGDRFALGEITLWEKNLVWKTEETVVGGVVIWLVYSPPNTPPESLPLVPDTVSG